MTQPQVSIIIPCYNAEPYLAMAIESTLSQDCVVQVIVIDDGSTDGSAMVARRYQPAIQLISTPNRGVANARNAAIPLLEAPYTLLLDADDRLAPNGLKHLMSVMNQRKDRVAFGLFQSWNMEMTRPTSQNVMPHLKPNAFVFFSGQNFSPPSAYLFPTNAFERVGSFDQEVAGCEDWDFLVRLARLGLEFKGIRKLVFHYRRMASSASNQPLKMLKAGLDVIRRAHGTDERVPDSMFPQGVEGSRMDDKLFQWGAHCLASEAVRDGGNNMEQLFQHIPVPTKADWEKFGTKFFHAARWHCDAFPSDDFSVKRKRLETGTLNGARFLVQHIPRSPQRTALLRLLLYPKFFTLLRWPGPKKTLRLWREWSKARALVIELDRNNGMH